MSSFQPSVPPSSLGTDNSTLAQDQRDTGTGTSAAFAQLTIETTQASTVEPGHASQEDGEWEAYKGGGYNSTVGIYYLLPWTRKNDDGELCFAQVPWKAGLAPADHSSSIARMQELQIVKDKLKTASHGVRDSVLNGVMTPDGQAMSWEEVKAHFGSIWPSPEEVEAYLASLQAKWEEREKKHLAPKGQEQ
ncbi:hypothetical protein NCC49_004068 [Naganishia albida]|nr:hypothetical protein NCC49_004068 [Naganishia albida]